MKWRLLRTPPFLKQYQKLPLSTRKKFDRQIEMLATQGMRHTGLSARKMVGQDDIWEARIDLHYRFTFQLQGDVIVLRRIGTHEIYRKP